MEPLEIRRSSLRDFLHVVFKRKNQILLFFVVLRAWRQRQAELRIWRATIVVMCSFLAEILIGILLIVFEFEPWLLVAYVVAAAVLWTSLVVVTVLACMDPNHNSIKEAS